MIEGEVESVQVALVKVKKAMPYIPWRLINKKVKELGGKFVHD